nr:MAG TPA: YsxB-like protein [Caudoviricetes sp.]
MTTVTLESNRLSVVGHAGYGKVGYDIVCAGISTLTFTLKESLELYTSDCVEFFIADGKVIASWSELSDKGALLLNSYITGALMLANDYPDNIQVQTLNTLKSIGNTAQTLNALKSMENENSIVKNGGNYYEVQQNASILR